MKTNGSDQNDKGKSLERSPAQSIKDLLNSDYVKNRFMEVMGEKAPAFLASVLSAIQKSPDLAKCDQNSLLSSAMVAATLDLPIDSNLGFAAIVPYNTKIKTKKDGKEIEIWITLAQFQIMYKGFIQLALRSGQYKTINVSPIYEDEFDSYDIITGDIVIHPVSGGYREQENLDKIIGYVAFFRLINGFERIEYWSLSKLKAHGERYSKSFHKTSGLWKKDPHAMFAKTVLKNTLSKWGILSVTMQTAIVSDQGLLKDWKKPISSENVDYVDNTEAEVGTSESTGSSEDSNPNEENTGSETSVNETAQEAEKENGSAEKEAAPKANGNGDLFPKDEADALEEQYEREQAGHDYPDFSNK